MPRPRKDRETSELNCYIDSGLHRRLKAYASLIGITMTEMVEMLIEEGVPELRTVDVAGAVLGETRAA